jgi:hypothetical protein
MTFLLSTVSIAITPLVIEVMPQMAGRPYNTGEVFEDLHSIRSLVERVGARCER